MSVRRVHRLLLIFPGDYDSSRAKGVERQFLRLLDLEVGIRDEKRNWLFLKAGGDAGMVVLQEDKGDWPLQHFAFTIDEADIERAAAMLRERGVEVEGPVYHEWMPSTSLYFEDPDGHALELLAVVSK